MHHSEYRILLRNLILYLYDTLILPRRVSMCWKWTIETPEQCMKSVPKTLNNQITRKSLTSFWSKAVASSYFENMQPPVGILKICSKFTGEQPCWSVISIKLQSNIIEIALRWLLLSCPILLDFFTLFQTFCVGL